MVAKAGAQRSAKKLIRVQTLRLDLKKRKTWEVRDLTGGLGSSKKKKKKTGLEFLGFPLVFILFGLVSLCTMPTTSRINP